ncbi:hypothetical protein GEMRC1_001707 [Eukaryota sp. GEM-RC1]
MYLQLFSAMLNSSPSPPVSGALVPSPPSVAHVDVAPVDNLVVDPASFDGLVAASCEQLMDGIFEIAFALKFGLVVLKSYTDSYVLGCEKSEASAEQHPELTAKTKKVRTTCKTNCEFRIHIKLQDNYWISSCVCGAHNHDPLTSMKASKAYRRYYLRQHQTDIELSKNGGCTASQIISKIRNLDQNCPLSAKDVENFLTKLRALKTKGKTSIKALFDEFQSNDFWLHRYCIGKDEDELEQLLVTSADAAELTSRFPHVLIMDCTYKTNRYGLPLLAISGITNMQTSFISAFVFMREETEFCYRNALSMLVDVIPCLWTKCQTVITDREPALINALGEMLPNAKNQLCLWHINCNVEVQLRKVVKNNVLEDKIRQQWKELIYSTENAFQTIETDLLNCWLIILVCLIT